MTTTTDRTLCTLTKEAEWAWRLISLLRDEIRNGRFGPAFVDAYNDVLIAADTRTASVRERCTAAIGQADAAYAGHLRAAS